MQEIVPIILAVVVYALLQYLQLVSGIKAAKYEQVGYKENIRVSYFNRLFGIRICPIIGAAAGTILGAWYSGFLRMPVGTLHDEQKMVTWLGVSLVGGIILYVTWHIFKNIAQQGALPDLQ